MGVWSGFGGGGGGREGGRKERKKGEVCGAMGLPSVVVVLACLSKFFFFSFNRTPCCCCCCCCRRCCFIGFCFLKSNPISLGFILRVHFELLLLLLLLLLPTVGSLLFFVVLARLRGWAPHCALHVARGGVAPKQGRKMRERKIPTLLFLLLLPPDSTDLLLYTEISRRMHRFHICLFIHTDTHTQTTHRRRKKTMHTMDRRRATTRTTESESIVSAACCVC